MKEKQFKRCEGCEWDDCAELGSCGHSKEEEPVSVLRFPPGLIKMLYDCRTLSLLRSFCHLWAGWVVGWVFFRLIQHQTADAARLYLVILMLVVLCLVQKVLGVYLNRVTCKEDENDYGK